MTEVHGAPARIDDLNLSQLNLISALDSNTEGKREWSVEYGVGERIVRVSCNALPEYGIPFGIDNDVNVAILAHYYELGQPENGWIEISARQLMELCGFHRNGDYYDRLTESLRRLHTTSYEVSGGWRDHPNRRWTTAAFHIISSLHFTSKAGGLFDDRSVIRLRLAEEIVSSIRGGFTKPLNLDFLRKLSRPRTRTLFRLLDGMRVNPESPDEVIDQFEVDLLTWAAQCKIPADRPDAVRRALEKPHEELIHRGYLISANYEGRGRKQRIQYVFSPDFMPVSPALLDRFRRHGVTDGVIRQLARTYPATSLMRELERFEALVASGQLTVKKTSAAALVHLIKHPDQYPQAAGAAPRVTRSAPKVAVAEPDLPTGRAAIELDMQGLTPDGRADFALKRLKLYFRSNLKLTLEETDTFRAAVMDGTLSVPHLLEEALSAMTNLQAQVFVDELHLTLRRLAAAD